MTLICQYKGERKTWKAEELKKALDDTTGPENAKDRALLLLQWSGRLTADYLAKDSGVEPWVAAEILRQLEKDHYCQIITLPDP